MEYVVKRNDKKKFIIVVILIIAIASALFFIIPHQTITGYVIKNIRGSDSHIEQENNGLDSETNENALSNLQTINLENIKANLSLKLESYEISIPTSNIDIESQEIIITDSEKDIAVFLNEETQLTDFTGKISFENTQIILYGKLTKYSNNHLKIDWKDAKDAIIKINDGFLEIKNFTLNEFDEEVSGTAQLPKMFLELYDDRLYIKHFQGLFSASVAQEITLNGEIKELRVQTQNFNLMVE